MLLGTECWKGFDHNEQSSLVFKNQDEGCVQSLHVTGLLLHMEQIIFAFSDTD
jgi:hypothetical protein